MLFNTTNKESIFDCCAETGKASKKENRARQRLFNIMAKIKNPMVEMD
jgi:hypothetical protein